MFPSRFQGNYVSLETLKQDYASLGSPLKAIKHDIKKQNANMFDMSAIAASHAVGLLKAGVHARALGQTTNKFEGLE